MYEEFYGFKEKPFSMLPDPGFLFLSKKHQAALTLLEYGVLNHVGFCVITGGPGAGKTTLIRALLQRTGENISVGLITNTHQSFGGLLDWVLSAFNLHRPNLTSVEMHQIFMEYLIEEYANNRTALLVVDEAQNMKPDTLEELRMLSNVNSEKDQLLQVVLSGQPALKEMLSKPELMQFAQRIGVDYHLDELNLEETCGYIQHRLLTAGATRDVFTPAACERIYNYSGGTPRLINLLCETVLVYGFADQLEMIEFDLVDEMVRERMKGSVVPIVNRDVGRPDSKEANDKLERDFPWIAIDSEAEGLKSAVEKVAVMALDEESSIDSDEEATSIENAVVEASTEQDVSEEVTDIQEEVVDVIPQEKKTESVPVEAKPQPEDALEENVSAPASVNKPAPEITGEAIPSVEEKVMVGAVDPFIKYGVIAIVFALMLIIFAVMLSGSDDEALDVLEKEAIDSQERERLRIQQLQIDDEAESDAVATEKVKAEAEAIKELEAAALLKSEEAREKTAAEKKAAEGKAVAEKKTAEDKAAKKQAEKKAVQQKAEEKALTEKAANKKKIRDEQKRIAIIKEREREEGYAVEREKRKAAKIAEEERLRDEEEVRRLEQEWLENERKNLETLDSSQIDESDVVVEKTVTLEKDSNPDCRGPTARFKSNCR
jgi:type II secretory pathway predicted ATPase ExeA